MPQATPTGPCRRPDFTAWCQCARLLLGWDEGDAADWADLYGAGATPLEVARMTAFGNDARATTITIEYV